MKICRNCYGAYADNKRKCPTCKSPYYDAPSDERLAIEKKHSAELDAIAAELIKANN